jgi:hypothetical protein
VRQDDYGDRPGGLYDVAEVPIGETVATQNYAKILLFQKASSLSASEAEDGVETAVTNDHSNSIPILSLRTDDQDRSNVNHARYPIENRSLRCDKAVSNISSCPPGGNQLASSFSQS